MIILVGPVGAGKSVQAQKLVKAFFQRLEKQISQLRTTRQILEIMQQVAQETKSRELQGVDLALLGWSG